MFKKLFRSRTTQNVAAAGGTIAAILAAIRSLWPDLLPWPVDADVTVAAVLTAVLGRVFAMLRTPAKLDGMTPPLD